ncbi:MAG TPA: DUF3568 family protein [Longimicrobiales bacterium]
MQARILPVLLVGLLGSGCAAAAAGGAVAGAQMAAHDQMADTHVAADMTAVATATEAAFRDLHITLTKRETENDEIEIKGQDGDRDINVQIKPNKDMPGHTSIEVSAVKNKVDYSKSRATEILTSINAHLK